MASPDRYPVPSVIHRVEGEVTRSRFITTIGRAATVEDATAFIAGVRAEFPDATHHCWAYVAGPPADTSRVGMSDDGEPHGTAGRPMLAVLLHSGVGDVVVVVTRYYGGTKLGTGGLVRAYSGGVLRALTTMPRTERVDWVTVSVVTDYARVSAVQQLFPEHEAEVLAQRFEADVTFDLRLPRVHLEAFRAAILDATRGQATVREC